MTGLQLHAYIARGTGHHEVVLCGCCVGIHLHCEYQDNSFRYLATKGCSKRDAALGLQAPEHTVDIYTSHHNKKLKDCFDEARGGKSRHSSELSCELLNTWASAWTG